MKDLTKERLKKDYEVKKETNVDKALKLDKIAKRPAYIFAYTFGTIGALILGFGMSIAMGVILSELFILGIIIGVIGIAMVSLTYPLFKLILNNRKDKFGGAILALLNEDE